MANRYSRLQQPLLIDPLSVEELSRVPLAKAMAEAEGLAAVNRVKTDFNVDQKDLNSITGLVGDLDKRKETIIDNIANNGINNQSIQEVLKLRNDRNELYKSTVNKAEENKLRIDRWKTNIDKATMSGNMSPQFGQLVKDTGYNQWTGTMQDGVVTEFEDHYGTQYIDVDKDIQNLMSKAKVQLEDTDITKFHYSVDPLTGNIIVTQQGETKNYSNVKHLQEAIKILETDYSTPGNVRGDFASYTGLTKDEIVDKLNKYKDFYTQTETTTTGGQRRFIPGPRPSGSSKKDSYLDTRTDLVGKLEVSHKAPIKQLLPTNEAVGGTLTFGKDYAESFVKNIMPVESIKKINSGQAGAGDYISAITSIFSPLLNFPISSIKGTMAGQEANLEFTKQNDINRAKELVKWEDNGMMNYMRSEGLVSQDLFTKAKKGDKKALKELFNTGADHIIEISNKSYNISGFPKYWENTYFGKTVTGQSRRKASEDLGGNIGSSKRRIYDYETRKLIEGKERNELADGLLNTHTFEITHSLPIGSPVTYTEDGDYIKGMSQAMLVSNAKTGEKYWVENVPTTINSDMYYHGQNIEEYISKLNVGDIAPINISGGYLQGHEDPNAPPINAQIMRSYVKDMDNEEGFLILYPDGTQSYLGTMLPGINVGYVEDQTQ